MLPSPSIIRGWGLRAEELRNQNPRDWKKRVEDQKFMNYSNKRSFDVEEEDDYQTI